MQLKNIYWVDIKKFYALILCLILVCGSFSKAIIEVGTVLLLLTVVLCGFGIVKKILPVVNNSNILQVKIPLEIFLFCLYFVWVFISTLNSDVPQESIRDFFTKFSESGLYFLVTIVVFLKGNIYYYLRRFIIPAFFVGVIILVIDCLWQFISGEDFLRGVQAGKCYFFDNWHKRLKGPFANENTLACYLLFPLFFNIGFLEDQCSKQFNKKTGLIILFSLILTSILFLTYSRGAWLAFLFGLIIYLLLPRRKNSTWRIIFLATVVVGVLCFPILCERFQLAFSARDGSGTMRLLIWKDCLKMITDFPIWGVGFNQFQPVYAKMNFVFSDTVMHSHNIFLKIAVEAGIMSMVLFVSMFALFVWRLLRALKKFPENSFEKCYFLGYTPALLAILFYGLFDNTLFSPQIYPIFWLCAAFGFLLSLNDRSFETS